MYGCSICEVKKTVRFPSTAGGVGGVTAMHHCCSESLAFMLHATLPCTVAMVTASSLTCGCVMCTLRESDLVYINARVCDLWVGAGFEEHSHITTPPTLILPL